MIRTDTTNELGRPPEAVLADLVEEITEKLEAGEPIDLAHYESQNPALASQLSRLVPALQALDDLGLSAASSISSRQSSHAAMATGRLGDFRIIRELGRGGMGVVYEAEQLSIGRRVALKVLPFAAMLDQQQLNRFKNEARAAGTLDHPNIVAIHSVGCERGVHYYAMQLIEGRSLAEIIAAMKPGRPKAVQETQPHGALLNDRPSADTAKAALSTVTTLDSAALSSLPAFESREYFRAVAKLGIQAAEALDHAHQNGILHRDIKPANLLVDDTGKLWITDFGLARIEQDAGMTMTGDILGTLRYMSPEQALAKRVVVDHRSDIYSLGVTLYELLTLQPAFTGDDRQELLRQIAFEEPRKPRSINARIPQDLETIVLKAIEKNPSDRYTTSYELADDLQRVLSDQPIRAKRQGFVAAAHKWSRRHRGLLVATAATVLISGLILAGSIGWGVRDRAARQSVAEAAATTALSEATRLVDEDKWPEALIAVQRADDVFTGTDYSGPLSGHVREMRTDIEMVLRLEEIRAGLDTENAINGFGSYDPETDRKNEAAFREYGIDVNSLAPVAAADLIARSRLRTQLATALDTWAQWKRTTMPHDESWRRLVDIARIADPDPWRNRLRDALGKKGRERNAAVTGLVASIDAERLPLRTVLLFVNLLRDSDEQEKALTPLLGALKHHPGDFWLNATLGSVFGEIQPARLDEAVCYNSIARALRPESALANNNLGVALERNGLLVESIACFQKAIQIRSDHRVARSNLAFALSKLGRPDEAIASLREVVRLYPDNASAHENLANVLAKKGLLDEAITSWREAIRLKPDGASAHHSLALQLSRKGLLSEAIASYREAVRLEPENQYLYWTLARELTRAGKLDDAMAELERVRSKFGSSHEITLFTTDAIVTVLAQEQHKLDAARRLGEEALAAARRDLGPVHRETLNAMKSLIRVLMWNGELLTETDAEYGQELCEETLELARRTLGPDEDECIGTAHDLAKLLQVRGRYEEALQLYETTLAQNRRVYDNDHYRNFHVMRDSASALLELGRTDEAAAKLEAAIEGFRPLGGETHGWTLEWTLLLAGAKSKQGHYDEARQMLEQVQETVRKTFSTDHAIVHQSARALAWFLATTNSDQHRDGERAVKLATEACELTKYANAEALDTLAAAYAETGDFSKAVEWENKALALIKNSALRKKYEAHLESFQAKKPWREGKIDDSQANGSEP